MSQALNIQMLGNFTLRYGDQSIDDTSNRMKKVWLLLAYLIFCRNSAASQEHYLSLLGSGEDSADPNGRLKAMFYRARTMLNQLSEDAGHNWIIRKNGTYAWNTDIPLHLDAEEFEQLCKSAEKTVNAEEKLNLYLQALELYKGDFLQKLAVDPWVMPINVYYHQLYLNACEQALELLESAKRWEDMASLCRKALKIEPYSEEICQFLMKACIHSGNRAEARRIYEEMSELIFSTFGVMPNEESMALYREASREEKGFSVPSGIVREQLREPVGTKGALYCEYDFFKLLYQVQARSILRSGDVIHIALFSIHGQRGKDLPRRSLDTAMTNLQTLMIENLRAGDVLTRCSISQMIVMLPQANYENSCMVCQRILRAFHRQYPHTPAEITYSVQPLEPLAAAPHPQH